MSTLNQCNGACENLLKGIQKKFEQQDMTDVIIKYGPGSSKKKGERRLVLCASSKYFNNMLGKMGFKENEESAIELKSERFEDEAVTEAVLGCLYGSDYNDNGGSLAPLHFNVYVYAAADYIDSDNIMRLATKKFLDAALAHIHANRPMNTLIGAMKLAYTETTPNDKLLRPSIAKFCVQHRAKVFASAVVPIFRSALQEVPELSADINLAFFNMFGGEQEPATSVHNPGGFFNNRLY